MDHLFLDILLKLPKCLENRRWEITWKNETTSAWITSSFRLLPALKIDIPNSIDIPWNKWKSINLVIITNDFGYSTRESTIFDILKFSPKQRYHLEALGHKYKDLYEFIPQSVERRDNVGYSQHKLHRQYTTPPQPPFPVLMQFHTAKLCVKSLLQQTDDYKFS